MLYTHEVVGSNPTVPTMQDTMQIKYVAPNVLRKAHKSDAAYDLTYTGESRVPLFSLDRATLGTGVYLDLPEDVCALVLPRSGNASKRGLTVLNTPGLVDPGYRGEVKVILANLSSRFLTVDPGERIAQLLFVPLLPHFLVKQAEINFLSDRGDKGFGSSG